MGIMQAFEPKEWSILRAVFTSMLPVITNNNTELTIMCYLSDLTLRRRRISVTRRVAGMFLEDYDPNSRPLKISYRHTFYCLLSLEMSNIFIRQDYDGPRKDYTINMVGILELYMKMTALRGANISDYLKLLEKTRTVFPSGMDIQRGLEVNVKTIEEAVRLGQELRKSRVGSKKLKKTITHLELQNYMDNAARTHDKSLYPLNGLKDISILRRFIKDCAELGTTAYEVIDYVLDHYQELNVYSQQSGSFNLAFSVFDFETIYYNKKEVLVWFLHTKEHGFYDVNKSVIEQAGESIGIKVIPFKKRESEVNVPWNRKPTGDPETDSLEEHVYAKLHDNGYAMFDLKKTPHEDPVFINACERLLTGLVDFKWIMVVSNSKKLLQELSSVFPVIYALNNLGKSAITLNGEELTDIFMGKENERGLVDKDVVKTSLIYLHDFLKKGKLLKTLETGMDSFLGEVINRKLIINMYTEESDRDKALKLAFERIEFIVSKEIASCLKSECAAMHVYIEPTNHLVRAL